MTAKFTPGPWQVINTNDPHLFPSVVLHERGESRPAQIVINEGADPDALSRGEYFGTTMETAAANAHLIAAAPHLYAVLNYVADMTYCGVDAEWHFKPGYDPQRVLDAIAEAEGQP